MIVTVFRKKSTLFSFFPLQLTQIATGQVVEKKAKRNIMREVVSVSFSFLSIKKSYFEKKNEERY
jgi:hypothetical protein